MYYHICFTSFHSINHWFMHLLCIFCMMNVRVWQGNIVLRNISDVTEGVHWVQLHHPRQKSHLFKKNTKREFSICFCLILTFGLLWKNVTTCPFRRVVKIIQNESFKDNICSIAMSLQQFGFVALIFRSSRVIVLKKDVLKNSAILSAKHLCRSFFFCSSFCSLWGKYGWDGSIN